MWIISGTKPGKMTNFTKVLSTINIILSIILLFIVETSVSVRFDLMPNTKRCIKEEMRKNLLAVGEYEISSLPGSNVDFHITDSKGHSALMRDNIDGKGKFAVTSDEDDIYDFCFIYSSSPHATNQLPREVYMNVRLGVEAKEYDEPSSDKMKLLEAELAKLQDLTNSIIEDFAHLKKRESEMQDTNASTSNRIFWQTVLSMLIVVGLALWQVLYLRKFFKLRRIID